MVTLRFEIERRRDEWLARKQSTIANVGFIKKVSASGIGRYIALYITGRCDRGIFSPITMGRIGHGFRCAIRSHLTIGERAVFALLFLCANLRFAAPYVKDGKKKQDERVRDDDCPLPCLQCRIGVGDGSHLHNGFR